MNKILKYISISFLIIIMIKPGSAQEITYEQYKLKNGLQITLIDFGSVDATTITTYVNVGKKNETPGFQGMSGFAAQAITLGNAKYNKIQLYDALYPMAANIESSANDNFSRISATFLNSDLDKGMEIYAATIRQPTFPESEIKQYISEFIQYNNTNKMDISDLASRFADYFVYGINNPLGRNSYSAQVQKLLIKDIKEFYDFNYTPKNCKIVVAGKIDKVKIKQLIDTYFGNWETVYGENNQVNLETPTFKSKEYAFVNRDNATQVYLHWCKKAPYNNDKDLLAFNISTSVFNKKLFEEVREKLGKTYGIRMSYSAAQNNGVYSVSTQTLSKEMSSTIQAFENTLGDFYNKGITEKELKTAKMNLKNSFLSINIPATIIDMYNPLIFPDFKKRAAYISELDKITLDIVNKVIKKYYNPNTYKLIIVGNEKELNEQLTSIKDLQKFANNAIEKDM
jgi:zinc protease